MRWAWALWCSHCGGVVCTKQAGLCGAGGVVTVMSALYKTCSLCGGVVVVVLLYKTSWLCGAGGVVIAGCAVVIVVLLLF